MTAGGYGTVPPARPTRTVLLVHADDAESVARGCDQVLAQDDAAPGASLVEAYVRQAPTPSRTLDSLTEREFDGPASAGGLTNAEIGGELYPPENTVRTHVAHILAKLGVRDRVQAVVLAHRPNSWTPADHVVL